MKGLDGQALEQVADYFKALAEPTRLRLLNALRDGEMNVGELTAIADCSQANVSKHLSLLTKEGLVARRNCGTSVYYSIADPAIYRLCDLVCGQVAKRISDQSSIHAMLRKAAKAPSHSRIF